MRPEGGRSIGAERKPSMEEHRLVDFLTLPGYVDGKAGEYQGRPK